LRLATLLEHNNLAYADLTRIGVTTGPGSFTGLRIGLAAARGLGLALDIPVLGIPSLFALSLAGPPGHPVAILVDARRDEAYFQLFDAPGFPAKPAELLPMGEARLRIPSDATLLETPFVDIARLARFAATADPTGFRPEASYIRSADAKPQDKARVARVGAV
jgi:tRNA threonylcarbamoyl adenosine modification protein YeaZ